MKKVWDFLLLVVSGLLVFVAIIAVALWLSREDEPPATADSRGGSTVQGGTAPSAAVQRHEPMAGASASASADSLTRHEETREASPEGMAQGASDPSVPTVPAAPSTAPTSAAQSSDPSPMSEGGPPNSS